MIYWDLASRNFVVFYGLDGPFKDDLSMCL